MTATSAPHAGRFGEGTGIRIASRQVHLLARRAARLVPSRQAGPAWAIASAGLSPILLGTAWLVAGVFQPPSYSPVRQTMSVLAGHAGTDRWIVTGAIFLVGGCHFVTALGLTAVRASARVLLAVAGVAAIGIAASPEPAHGSTPQHLAWTSLGAVAIAVWPAFAAQPAGPRPRVLSVRASATVTTIFIALLGWVLIETRGGNTLGLAERLTTMVQISWPLVVALATRRTSTDVLGRMAPPRRARRRSARPIRPRPAARVWDLVDRRDAATPEAARQ